MPRGYREDYLDDVTPDDGADPCASPACGHRRDRHASWWDGAVPDFCTTPDGQGGYCGCDRFEEPEPEREPSL
jgi:hypothetical protein